MVFIGSLDVLAYDAVLDDPEFESTPGRYKFSYILPVQWATKKYTLKLYLNTGVNSVKKICRA